MTGPTGPTGVQGQAGISGGLTLFMDSAGGTSPVTGTLNTSIVQGVQSTLTSGSISSQTAFIVGTFVTPPSFLTSTIIAGGLWDLNIYSQANATGITLYAGIYQVDSDGSNPVQIALQTSAGGVQVPISSGIVNLTVYVNPFTLTDLTKRISIVLYCDVGVSSRTLSIYFRGSTISHVHTTLLQVIPKGDTGYTGSTGNTGNTGPPGVLRPLQSISYYLSSPIAVSTSSQITYDTLDASNSYGTVGFSYSSGLLTNTSTATLTLMISGQVITDNRVFDLNFAQPTITVKKGVNNMLTSSVINFQGSSFSTTVILAASDTVSIWYSQYFGNTINVLAGQYNTRITFTQLDTVQGSTLIGTDLNNVAYSQYGLATPFITVGPAVSTPGAIGGWKVGPTGTMGSNDYNLIAQQLIPSGVTGPIYSILTPSVILMQVNNLTSGYTFRPVDRGSIFLLTSPSNSAPFGISAGFLGAQDEGFYVTLKNENTFSSAYTIPVYSGSLVPSTGTSTLGSGSTAILYWNGTSFSLYE